MGFNYLFANKLFKEDSRELEYFGRNFKFKASKNNKISIWIGVGKDLLSRLQHPIFYIGHFQAQKLLF
jgi:hypothetical protein